MNIKELLAQAYCTPENKHKILDVALLDDMNDILLKEIRKLPRYFFSNCQGVIKNKRIGRFILIDDILRR